MVIAIRAVAENSSGVTNADTFAKIGTPLEEGDCLRCDGNEDGILTAQDTVNCFWLTLSNEWSEGELCGCDFNEDGEITAQDAVDCYWWIHPITIQDGR
jgi:hypothetical protein